MIQYSRRKVLLNHCQSSILLRSSWISFVDAPLVLTTVARVAVGSAATVLATVGSAFRVHAHYVLLQVRLGHETFRAQLTMILLLLVVLGNVQSEYTTVLEHFHTELANKCFITVHCTHMHLQIESPLENLVTISARPRAPFHVVVLHLILHILIAVFGCVTFATNCAAPATFNLFHHRHNLLI